jgi:hypothetical protein
MKIDVVFLDRLVALIGRVEIGTKKSSADDQG